MRKAQTLSKIINIIGKCAEPESIPQILTASKTRCSDVSLSYPRRARAIENIQVPQLICISERHVIDTHAASQIRRYADVKIQIQATFLQMRWADNAVGSFIWLGACGSDSISDCLQCGKCVACEKNWQ